MMSEASRARSRAELYDGFATVGKALAAGRRLEILDFLSQGPRSVGHLASELDQSVANTSQHLRVLLDAGLVTATRVDHRVFYELRSQAVSELLLGMCELAVDLVVDVPTLAEAHVGSRRDVAAISRRELVRRMRVGDVVVIDVRPSHDYEAGHIAGALSVPEERLDAFAESLSADSEVVAYCRGEYCALADVVVRRLQFLGFRARRLEGGFPQWVADGGDHQRIA